MSQPLHHQDTSLYTTTNSNNTEGKNFCLLHCKSVDPSAVDTTDIMRYIMPSSHRRHRQVLCCRQCEQNWRRRQVKTVFSSPQYIGNLTVLFSLVYGVNAFAIVLVANWKLGRDKTKLRSDRISRLDKTAEKNEACLVSKFSVADNHDLSPVLFTPPTRTRQCGLVHVGGVN